MSRRDVPLQTPRGRLVSAGNYCGEISYHLVDGKWRHVSAAILFFGFSFTLAQSLSIKFRLPGLDFLVRVAAGRCWSRRFRPS